MEDSLDAFFANDSSDVESMVASPVAAAADATSLPDTLLDLVLALPFQNVTLVVQSFLYDISKMRRGASLDVEISAEFGKAHSCETGTGARILAAEFLDGRLRRLSEWHFALTAFDSGAPDWVFKTKDEVQDHLIESVLNGYVRTPADKRIDERDDCLSSPGVLGVPGRDGGGDANIYDDDVETGCGAKGGTDGGAEGGSEGDAKGGTEGDKGRAFKTPSVRQASEAEGLGSNKRCVCDCGSVPLDHARLVCTLHSLNSLSFMQERHRDARQQGLQRRRPH